MAVARGHRGSPYLPDRYARGARRPRRKPRPARITAAPSISHHQPGPAARPLPGNSDRGPAPDPLPGCPAIARLTAGPGFAETKTAVVRAGTVRVRVAALKRALRTTGSADALWIGWSTRSAPANTGSAKRWVVAVALKTTTIQPYTGSTRAAGRSARLITIRPGTWVGPVLRKRTRSLTAAAVSSRKSFELLRMRSISWKWATAPRMSALAGLRAGLASSGRMIGQFVSPFSLGGKPTPQLLDVYEKSSRLNQSPEL